MPQKFGRNYRLTIYPLNSAQPIIIQMPFTVKFSITRSIASNQNPISLEIYNLSEQHRNQIYQDWYVPGDPVNADGSPAVDANGQPLGSNNLILEAGYSELYRVFLGRMFEAYSSREGVDIITRILGFDNNVDIVSTQTFATLQSGQTLGQVLTYLAGQFPNLKIGGMGDYSSVFNRPVVLNGVTWDLLKKYSGGNVYIDQGKIYLLRDNEVLDAITTIDDSTGLLETPRREQGILYLTMLFEPSLQVGQQVKVASSIQQSYNGTYRVNGISHRGMISEAVCGRLVTVLELLAPNQFNGFTTVNQQ